MLHYAESIIERKTETYAAATGIDQDGKTIWTNYQNIDMDIYDDFNDLGLAFETHNSSEFKQVNLNRGFIKAINVKPLVDFAKIWFRQKDNNL